MLIIAPEFTEIEEHILKVKSTLTKAKITFKKNVDIQNCINTIDEYDGDYYAFRITKKNKLVVTLK